jgi:hypothetical protein
MIHAEINLGVDYFSVVNGETIEEIIEKIKDYHTMSSFERDILIKKKRLDEALASGWYIKESLQGS